MAGCADKKVGDATLTPAYGRSISDFQTLNDAEKKLIASVKMGEVADIGGDIPSAEATNVKIRAGLVRFLALGGDAKTPVHEHGVRIKGAWISEKLDFDLCKIKFPISLEKCHAAENICLKDCEISSVRIDECVAEEIDAERLRCIGPVSLDGSRCRYLNLKWAQIGGSFVCPNLKVKKSESIYDCVVDCEGIRIDGDLCFGTEGKSHETEIWGYVQLNGAKVKGDIDCTAARFMGGIWFIGADVGGDLDLSECKFGKQEQEKKESDQNEKNSKNELVEIILTGISIGGRLFFRSVTGEIDGISLRAAKCRALIDEVKSWSTKNGIILDGFQYERFLDSEVEGSDGKWIDHRSPTDANSRINWLRLQRPEDWQANFKPQPWEQLVRVLREMGHSNDARRVAIAKQDWLLKSWASSPNGKRGQIVWLSLYGCLTKYGYGPWRLIPIAFVVALVFAFGFKIAARNGIMAPTDRAILETIKSPACRPEQGGNWTTCAELERHQYSVFDPLVYSLDLILPVISTQQAKEWSPLFNIACRDVGELNFCRAVAGNNLNVTSAYSKAGVFFWLLARVETLAGWIFGLLFVAIVGGWVKKD